MPIRGRNHQNEHPEFEFLSHPKEGDLILKNAPFGTSHTPTTRMKIVGGKPVYFIDSGTGLGGSSTSPRAVIKGVSAKPNEIDPWEIQQPGYSTADKDLFNSQIHEAQKNGHLINPYRVIPPIKHNSPTPRRDVNINNNINNNLQSSYQGQTSIPYQYDTSQSYPPLSEKERLLRLLPRTEYLPRQPLQLAKEDEYRLLSLLNDELRELEAQRLKDIYVDLTSFDKQLRGFCLLQDLSYVLGKHGIFLSPDILRLVACQYVSDLGDGKVNYEKVLSFFGAALRTSQSPTRQMQPMVSSTDRPRSEAPPGSPPTDRPSYYVPKEPKPMTPPNDSELSKLVRLVEQQLLDSDVEIDFDRLALDFRKMDPNHRGTMSAAQVKQIVYSPAHQIPLQESLVNQILSKCDHHGDGQYQWMQFIEFLEKVQPRQTGLILPKSKRPLEYAKNYGKPSPNWPHAETPRANFQPKVAKQENIEDPTRRTPLPTYARDYNGNQSHQYEETGRVSKLEVERKEQQLRAMEREYETMKSQLAEEQGETEPWFQRFLKMASSVYSQDTDNSGYLPYDEVKKLIRLYNDAYNLRLQEHDIDRAMMDNYSKGRVAIHPILTVLGAKST